MCQSSGISFESRFTRDAEILRSPISTSNVGPPQDRPAPGMDVAVLVFPGGLEQRALETDAVLVEKLYEQALLPSPASCRRNPRVSRPVDRIGAASRSGNGSVSVWTIVMS